MQLYKKRDGVNIVETSHIASPDVFALKDSIEVVKWRKMNEHFEETCASNTVLNTVTTHGFVMISGPPGSGKSAIAYNTAFMLEKNEQFEIVSVSSPEDIRKYLLPETRQVFVIDDPVGKYTVNETSIQRWKNDEIFVKQIFINCLKTKFILTCRSYIYKFGFCRKLNFSPMHCDLLSYNLKLSFIERRNICQRYKIPDLNEDTIMMYDFLPLLCTMYSENDNAAMFFVNPFTILTEEMKNIKETSDIAFLALALLVVQNNTIDRYLLSLENAEIKELLNDLCNECGFTFFPSITVLLSALSDLIGTYIKETDDGFTCSHYKLFQNLSCIVGSCIIHCLLKYGSSRFLYNRLQLVSIQEVHTELTIMVQPEQEESYFQRLMLDIRKGNHSHVFTGIQMKHTRFRSKLHQCLKHLKAGDLTWDQNNSTPLHVVSEQGYDDLVFTLYQIKRDHINHQDNNKRTPLFVACLGGHDNVIQTIIGIDRSSIHVADNADLMPMDAASLNDHSSTVSMLIKQGAKVNRKDTQLRRTALQRACESGSPKVVKLLLTYRSDVYSSDINGLKAIHIACQRGHVDIVELLLKYKNVMINENDARGRTPIFIACENNQQHIVCMLLEKKANVNKTNYKQISPLYTACRIGNEKIVKLLLDNYAKVNITSDYGYSPLHVASMKGKLGCVEMLLDKNADIYLATDQGLTPFSLSCSKGHLDICNLLHLSGASVNVCDKFANTPLHFACREKHERIVRFLVEHNADINVVNTKRVTSLYIACVIESFDIVELLLNYHADVNMCEEEGNSPLHVACLKGNKQIVQLLLDKKADKHKQNKAGKSPCDVVQHVQGGDADVIVEMLNRYKAK